jgi:hypothetical protein
MTDIRVIVPTALRSSSTPPNTLLTETITLVNSTAAPVIVSDGEYRIDGGAWKSPENTAMPAMNIGQPPGYSSQSVFIDHMKSSGAGGGEFGLWIPTGGTGLTISSKGWITGFGTASSAYTTFNNGNADSTMEYTNFTVIWTGGDQDSVTLEQASGSPTSGTKSTLGNGDHQHQYTRTAGSNGMRVRVHDTGITDIRVVPTTYEDDYADYPWSDGSYNDLSAAALFTGWLRTLLADYSTVRFMEWMRTNGSAMTDADLRMPVDYMSYWSNGSSTPYLQESVPWEIICLLCNKLDLTPWITVPHQYWADNTGSPNYTYTSFNTMAQFFLDNLNPGKKIFVEYSNEVWNGSAGFDQTDWVSLDASSPLGSGVSDATSQNYGVISHELLDSWETIWGAQAGRIIGVIGVQNNHTAIAERFDPTNGANYRSGITWTDYKDMCCSAPYIGGNAAGGGGVYTLVQEFIDAVAAGDTLADYQSVAGFDAATTDCPAGVLTNEDTYILMKEEMIDGRHRQNNTGTSGGTYGIGNATISGRASGIASDLAACAPYNVTYGIYEWNLHVAAITGGDQYTWLEGFHTSIYAGDVITEADSYLASIDSAYAWFRGPHGWSNFGFWGLTEAYGESETGYPIAEAWRASFVDTMRDEVSTANTLEVRHLTGSTSGDVSTTKVTVDGNTTTFTSTVS